MLTRLLCENRESSVMCHDYYKRPLPPPHPVLTAIPHLHTLRSGGCPARPRLQQACHVFLALLRVHGCVCSVAQAPDSPRTGHGHLCAVLSGGGLGVVLRRPTGRYQSPLGHLFLLASSRGRSECHFWLPRVGFPSLETSSLLLGGHTTRTFHHPSLTLKVWSRA